jgi:GNAT superfamily N-acetyltransferase
MIQPFTADDLLRIAHLQPDGWQDIGPFFRFYLDDPICRAYKIEEQRRIVAVGALILHVETAWLAHVIVAPEMRRKGLGMLMTQKLVTSAETYGRVTQLLIATKMGEPLYGRLGFGRSCDYLFYHPPVPGQYEHPPEGVRRLKPSDIPQIMAMDRSASGEDRQSLLSGFTGNGQVYTATDDKEIRGFYLPEFGEGLVVAQDSEAGQALMKLRLAEAKAAPVLPDANYAGNQLLQDLGLEVKGSTARMVRNGADPLQPEMLFNRIGGHLG